MLCLFLLFFELTPVLDYVVPFLDLTEKGSDSIVYAYVRLSCSLYGRINTTVSLDRPGAHTDNGGLVYEDQVVYRISMR